MENNQNTYNQQPMGPQGPMMPQQVPMQNRAPRGWRERWMHRFGMDTAAAPLRKGELTIPSWLVGSSIAFFFVAMFACWGGFGHVPGFDLVLVASISVIVFFYGGAAFSKSLSHNNSKIFLRNLFVAGFVLRLLWILYLYYIFNPQYYGNTYGEEADAAWYMPFGKDLAQWMLGNSKLTLSQLIKVNAAAVDDTGYPMWLGFIYMIVGPENDVFVPFVLKCIMGAYCAVSIYHIARRHYGEGVARMAAIFVCINPNMIYWCGTMLKETEMVFLCCLSIDNFDRVLNSGQRFTFRTLFPGMLAAAALMFFRAALGIVIFLAFFAHIVMASQRVMSLGKKIFAGLLVGAVLFAGMGDRIRNQTHDLMEKVQSDSQQKNMEWRAQRENGNAYAKYAGVAVFAPLIFTIPFPTFNQANEGQLLQVQLSGGSYIKNILSFFVILVMLMMLISREWRRHVFILAYTVGYDIILVMSPFAQSGRFHMPVIPLLMLFAAYGIHIAKTNNRVRKWYPIVLMLEVAVCIAWNWFKLKGRGMI